MKCVQLQQYNGVKALQVVECEKPTAKGNEVIVEVTYTPINPSDLLFIEGKYGVKKPLPCVPGFEGSGRVVETGGGLLARRLKGKRVAFISATDGTWAQYVKTNALMCLVLPDDVSDELGAMSFINPLTAFAFFDIMASKKEEGFVHTAAASSVGKHVTTLSKEKNVPVIHVVHKQEHVETLKKLGATHILNSTDENFKEQLKTQCKQLHIRRAFDAVGGELAEQLLQCMPKHSTLQIYGLLSNENPTFSVDEFVFQGKTVTGFWLSRWIAKQSPFKMYRTTKKLSNYLTHAPYNIQGTYPLNDVQKAIETYTSNMSKGKVLLQPNTLTTE